MAAREPERYTAHDTVKPMAMIRKKGSMITRLRRAPLLRVNGLLAACGGGIFIATL
jgi:hypothetical protein